MPADTHAPAIPSFASRTPPFTPAMSALPALVAIDRIPVPVGIAVEDAPFTAYSVSRGAAAPDVAPTVTTLSAPYQDTDENPAWPPDTENGDSSI